MKKVFSKSLSCLLSVVMLLGLFVIVDDISINVNATQNMSSNFSKNYALGSDQRQNLVNVAIAQLGKKQADLGYTENWCADFVCDCARLTGMSDSIIPYNYSDRGACRYLIKYMIANCGAKKVSDRQTGDLVFYYCSACGREVHVGIVLDGSYSIEGNYGGQVTKVSSSYTDSVGHTLKSGTIKRVYVRPNYGGSQITHVDPTPVVQPSTDNCLCSENYAGEYEVTTSSQPLTIRTGHGTNYSSIGSIPKGTHVYVTKADGTWAHVNYNNISGYVYMSYLTKVASPPVVVPDPPVNPTITDDSNIVANVESVTGGTNTITVTGWIFDRDDTSQTIAVDIYVGGVVGTSEAEGHRIFADVSRGDVHNAHGCGNNHGFHATFVTNKTGNQPVYLYGINVGNGGINPCIGTSSVYIDDPPKDVGTAFYAYIQNPFSGLVVGHTDGNVVIKTQTGAAEQQWFFVRQDDCSYEITNHETGQCLEVAEAGTGNCSNVRIWPDNDTVAQRWYIVGTPDRYTLVPKYAIGMAMDVSGGGISNSGTNIQLWEKNNTQAQIFSLQIFKRDTTSPVVSNVTVSKVSSKGYRITCNVDDDIGITEVSFPTWTDNNGQDDIIYYKGNVLGNTASVYIPTSKHNNEKGTYITHIYAYDRAGNPGIGGYGIVIHDDNEPYFARSTEYNGHIYTMYLADMTWTEAQAWCEKQGGYLATVTSQEEWNTIKWLVAHYNAPCCWLGAENTSGSWKWVTGENFTYSDWIPGNPDCANGNEFYLGTFGGNYYINAYQWNDFPNLSEYVGCFVMEEPLDKISPTVTNPTVSKVSGKGYQVTCNIEDNLEVTKVLFPTWTDKNEQDDVIYYEGTISGNTATVYIPTSKHNNETGLYHTHIYAYDAEGNSGFAGTACNVIDDEPYEMKSTEYNGHTYTMYLADMTWTEAQAWCKKQGGYLATVTSQEEWDTIKWLIAHNNAPCCWLGAESTSGSWKWVTGEDFTYSDWWANQPDCGGNKEFYLGTYEGTLINAYRWNDFSDKNDLVGCFVIEKAQLENKSTISAETIKLGETVTANARATGGTGEYLYQVVYKQTTQSKWTTAQSYKANATVTIKPTKATTYDVCVKVKDSNGMEVKKYFTVKVTDVLKNNSTLSKTEITLGDTITVNGKATGGSGSYQYNILYKQTAQTKWTTVQSYKANATVTIKPTKATTYDVCVKVKDSDGTEVKEYLTVNVTNNELKNISTISAETIYLGGSINVNAKATGSTGFYTYAVYYKKTSDTKWTTAQDFKSNNKVTVTPTKATPYDVCVKVKDDKGTIDKKYFTVNVTSNELKNTSTVSAETINIGESVTVNAKATGSTGFYTYAVYYKQEAQTKWTTVQDFKSNNKVTVKPAKATAYDICVKVKDDKGTIDKKYFKVNVTDFANTSVVSATEIKLGQTIEVDCSATGSTGFYQYAVYYKKTSDTKWTVKQSYSSNNTVNIKPTQATTYDVCVKIKDNQNNEVKRYFVVAVK